MKVLLTLALFLLLSSQSFCFAITAETKGSPCDSETVTIEHKASFERLRHASGIFLNADYLMKQDPANIPKAVDELDQSLDFLFERYHPTSKWSPDIPARLLSKLQNDVKGYKLKVPEGNQVSSVPEGIAILKQELNGSQRKTAIALLNVFTLYSLNQYDEALLNLRDINNIQNTKACLDFKQGIKDKKKAYADSFQGHIESFITNTLFVWLFGAFIGFLFFRKSGRPGWMLCIPLCWWVPYCVAFFLTWLLPFLSPVINILGFALMIVMAILWRKRFGPKRDITFGSAQWTSNKAAQHLGRIQEKGFVLSDSHGFALGRIPKTASKYDARLRYMGHVLTCAPTGAGKGIGAVIPNLLEYPGSALVLDVKGENYVITQKQRQNLGHEVFLIDPFGTTGQPSHALNVLDRLNPDNPNVVSDSAMLADMLVITGKDDSYWDEAAKDLLRGLMVYVAGLPDEQRHLGHVRHLLTGGDELLFSTLETMRSVEKGFGVVSRTANSFLSKSDKDRSGVLSSAIRHTAFLDDPRIVESLKRSDFSLDELKEKLMTVYIALPPAKIASYNRFMRCFIGMALASITDSATKPRFKVAFFLDEFAQLGRMTAIEDAISVVRGYGAAFWIFIQDLSQLRGVYPKWQTFLANAGAKQFFGTADFDTAKYISGALGQETVAYTTTGHSMQDTKFTGTTSTSQHLTGRSLLTPDEVMRMGAHMPIVLISGESPYLVQRLNYLQDKEYEGQFDKNPYHC